MTQNVKEKESENFIAQSQDEFFRFARIITKNKDLAIECTATLFSNLLGSYASIKEIDNNKKEIYSLFTEIINDIMRKNDKGYRLFIVDEQKKEVEEKDINKIYDLTKEEFDNKVLKSNDKMGYIYREITAFCDITDLSKEDIMDILSISIEEFYKRIICARDLMLYNLKTLI